MNIFVLDLDPTAAARYHCDAHVTKMILETAQLLCTAHRVLTGDEVCDARGLYKKTHTNHPCASWVRESEANYRWTYELFRALGAEYTRRYGRVHATDAKLSWELAAVPAGMPTVGPTPHAQCMPEELRGPDAVAAYREYYRTHKKRFARWRMGDEPQFMKE